MSVIYYISLTHVFVFISIFMLTIKKLNHPPLQEVALCAAQVEREIISDEVTGACAVDIACPPFGKNGSDHRRGAEKGRELCP